MARGVGGFEVVDIATLLLPFGSLSSFAASEFDVVTSLLPFGSLSAFGASVFEGVATSLLPFGGLSACGASEGGVAEDLFHVVEIGVGSDHLGGAGPPEGVRGDLLGLLEPGGFGVAVQVLADAMSAPGLPLAGEEDLPDTGVQVAEECSANWTRCKDLLEWEEWK